MSKQKIYISEEQISTTVSISGTNTKVPSELAVFNCVDSVISWISGSLTQLDERFVDVDDVTLKENVVPIYPAARAGLTTDIFSDYSSFGLTDIISANITYGAFYNDSVGTYMLPGIGVYNGPLLSIEFSDITLPVGDYYVTVEIIAGNVSIIGFNEDSFGILFDYVQDITVNSTVVALYKGTVVAPLSNISIFDVYGDTENGLGAIRLWSGDPRIQQSRKVISVNESFLSNLTTPISTTENISGSAFYGDGSHLTGIPTTAQTATTSISGSVVIDSFSESTADACEWLISVKGNGNLRASKILATWNGSGMVVYTETSTTDIGDTSDAVFSVDEDVNIIRLLMTSTQLWDIKTKRTDL